MVGEGVQGGLEEPLGAQQGPLRPLVIGDILDHTQHTDRPAMLIPYHSASFRDPANAAIRPDNAMLDRIVHFPLQAGVDRVHHPLAILGMDALEKGIIGCPELTTSEAKHGLDLIGPMEVTGADVPIPTSNVGGPLSQGIPFLAAPECFLHSRPLGDLIPQCFVGRGQQGRALGNQVFEVLAVLLQFRLNLPSLGDVAIAGPVAQEGTLPVCHRLTDVLDPTDIAVRPPDSELDLSRVQYLETVAVFDPGLPIIGQNQFVQ